MKKNIIRLSMGTVIIVAVVVVFKGNSGSGKLKLDNAINLSQMSEVIDSSTFRNFIITSAKEQGKLTTVELNTSTILQLDNKKTLGFNKKGEILFSGVAEFYVDLLKLKEEDIVYDSARQILNIYLDKPKLDFHLLTDETKKGEVKNGIFSWGEFKFTADQFSELESKAENIMMEEVSTEENFLYADTSTSKTIEAIFTPIVNPIVNGIVVKVVFK